MDNIYDRLMKPLESKWLNEYRKLIMPYAHGNVLEVGFGTGVNLKHYDFSSIQSFTALDLDSKKELTPKTNYPITYINGEVENLPFEDNSFDTIVETLVLCSVKDMNKAISEIFRVLKPGGTFIFIDHVLPEKPLMANAFKGVNFIWNHFTGGCNLTRQPHLILDKYNLNFIEKGSFANNIFRYGVVSKKE